MPATNENGNAEIIESLSADEVMLRGIIARYLRNNEGWFRSAEVHQLAKEYTTELRAKLAEQERLNKESMVGESNCEKLRVERATKRHWQKRAEAAEAELAALRAERDNIALLLEEVIGKVVGLIDASTGPIGGWLVSPKKLSEEINGLLPEKALSAAPEVKS